MMVQVVERATATQPPAAVETTGGGIGGVLAGLLGKVTVCGHDGSVFEFGPFVDHLECRAVVTPDVQQDLAAGLVQTKRLGQAEDLPRAKVRGVLHRIFVFLNVPAHNMQGSVQVPADPFENGDRVCRSGKAVRA